MAVVRNDVARGTLIPTRADKLGNRFDLQEVRDYYDYRHTVAKGKVPGLLTYLRILRRCTCYQLTQLYGLKKAAVLLRVKANTLSRTNSNYRLSRLRKATGSTTAIPTDKGTTDGQ